MTIKATTTIDQSIIDSIERDKEAALRCLTKISNGENPHPFAFHLAIDLGKHFTREELEGALQLYKLNSRDKIGADINIRATIDYITEATREYK